MIRRARVACLMAAPAQGRLLQEGLVTLTVDIRP
jgi:hypothetical protein